LSAMNHFLGAVFLYYGVGQCDEIVARTPDKITAQRCTKMHNFFDAIYPFSHQFWRGFALAAQLHKNAPF
ncbi:hypothetical protein, partial [Pectobacterium aquaticum]|uniref:hypothetical protein n=1 Tax=Pectobacterium aquaticum TaxID=2204145 RepID=UPI000E36D666